MAYSEEQARATNADLSGGLAYYGPKYSPYAEEAQ